MLTSSETTVTLPADVALHARPAAQFVRTAVGFNADIAVAINGREADAKSLLAILLDEAVGLQRLEEAVNGRHRQLEPLGELGHAEAARPARERLENACGTVD